jgi:hypothetical protein
LSVLKWKAGYSPSPLGFSAAGTAWVAFFAGEGSVICRCEKILHQVPGVSIHQWQSLIHGAASATEFFFSQNAFPHNLSYAENIPRWR